MQAHRVGVRDLAGEDPLLPFVVPVGVGAGGRVGGQAHRPATGQAAFAEKQVVGLGLVLAFFRPGVVVGAEEHHTLGRRRALERRAEVIDRAPALVHVDRGAPRGGVGGLTRGRSLGVIEGVGRGGVGLWAVEEGVVVELLSTSLRNFLTTSRQLHYQNLYSTNDQDL